MSMTIKDQRVSRPWWSAFAASLMLLSLSNPAHAGWKRANSSQNGKIAAVTRGDYNQEDFWIDATGAVNRAAWNNSTWWSTVVTPAEWNNNGPSNIAAVSRDANSWDAFYATNQNQLQHIGWSAAAGTVGPEPLRSSGTNPIWMTDSGSGISVISRAPNMLEIFYIGGIGNGVLQYLHSENSGAIWNTQSVSGSGMFWGDSRVVAISRDRNSFDVFVADKTGRLFWYSYTDDPSSENYGWGVHLLPTVSLLPEHAAITVVSRSPDTMDLFYIDGYGSVEHFNWSSGMTSFAGPFQRTSSGAASTASDIASVSRAANTMEVLFKDNNNTIVDLYNYDGVFYGPVAPTSPTPQASNSVAAISRTSSSMDVPYIDKQGFLVRQMSYDDSVGWNWGTFPANSQPQWPSHYVLANIDPNNFVQDWTNGPQGIAHSKYMWYYTATTTDWNPPDDTKTPRLCKFPISQPLTNFGGSGYCIGNILGFAWEHYGDLDVYGDFQFIPTEVSGGGYLTPPYLVILHDEQPTTVNSLNPFTLQYFHQVPSTFQSFAWLAINPRDGYLYSNFGSETSLTRFKVNLPDTSNSTVSVDWNNPQTISITLNNNLFHIKNSSGGAFSRGGHLYIVSADSSTAGIYGLDTNGAIHTQILGAANFPYNTGNGDEAEGADYIDELPSGYPPYSGPLHVQVANTHSMSNDGLSFYHYMLY